MECGNSPDRGAAARLAGQAEGLALLTALEASAQQDGRLLQHVGELYTHMGQASEACAAYARAAELEPSNPHYLYNLATARIALGEMDEAERLLDRVIARAPEDYDAWYNRATLRSRRGRQSRCRTGEELRRTAAPSGGRCHWLSRWPRNMKTSAK